MPPSTVRVSLKILGETVSVEAPQPPAQARLEDLLPLMTALDDAAVSAAIRAVEKAGETVSCCKGCSACCRAQPVPITPPEAFRLARYVEAQPEPRQSALITKFANRVERLREAGLLEGFREGAESAEQARRLATDYFRLGLICPFLDEAEGACGIYEIRPFVCRQYLVTSDPSLCADPLGLPVKRVPMPIAAAGATLKIAEQELGREQRSLPLVLALDYFETHRDDSERRFDSAQLAPRWVAALATAQASGPLTPGRSPSNKDCTEPEANAMIQSLPMREVRGACPHDCPDTCSWVVNVDESGKAVRMRGDAESPFTDGFLCQKVANYLDRVYHPGRLTTPLKRIRPKGEGRFAPISWKEAIDEIADKFKSISNGEHGPQAILPYSYAGTMGKLQYGSLDRRFFHRLGASLLDRTICATAGAVGCDITLGTRAVVDPESVIHAKYIVNWGSNTKVTNVHLWTIQLKAQKLGAKIVTIDPHRSKTAEASDWWIPIRPGTDAAFALGVMHILFRDSHEDKDYLESYCVGTEQLRERVKKEYTPQIVSKITGIPVADLERFARDYGTTKPAFIRLNYGLQRHGGGAMAVRTVCCLPAITGDWRYPGGGALLSTSKLYPFDDAFLTRPDLIPPGTRTINMTQLAEALNGDLPGAPVQALYVYNSNPAAVCPDQSRVLKGLKREDLFTVVHDQFQTDTADYADIVLPATTQLEHFDIHNSYGHLYVQVNNPAIAPLGESKPNTEVFRLLAKAMGFEGEIFAMGDEELARRAFVGAPLVGAQQAGHPQGVPLQNPFDGIDFDSLISNGPARLNVPKDFAPFATGKFPTPSGKCEFYSAKEAAAGRDPLPHYIPPHEDPQTKPELAAKFPLQLICPPTPSFLNSTFVNVDKLRARAGEPRVEMNTADAASRKIEAGQIVRVRNDRGSFRAKAIVGESVKPGVVVSFGIWWNKFTEDGVNVNTITSTALTDRGGGATFFDNLVEVEALI